MTEEKPKKKNYYEMEFCVKTELGKITLLYDYRDAWDAFKFDFNKKYAKSTIINGQRFVDAASWQWCIGHAHETLKDIFPQIIFDALEQAWLEARARTINELHDEPCFEIMEGEKDPIINPIQPLNKYNPASIKKFCKDVADKAYEDSRRRMKLDKRGGSRRKIGGIYYASLDLYYERFSNQAKSILKFYKWKKEVWESESRSNKGNENWNKYFLKNMFQSLEVKTLRDNQAKAKTKKDKLKFAELDEAALGILTIKDEEIERWKETFNIILAEDFSSQEAIIFDALTSETLTYHLLATIFNLSAGTVENNLKELRLDKKRMVKGNS